MGKVSGVYDSWKEAEKQVKKVRSNLYAKFETKKLAQEFVDSHSKKPRRAPSPTPSASSVTTNACIGHDDSGVNAGFAELFWRFQR